MKKINLLLTSATLLLFVVTGCENNKTQKTTSENTEAEINSAVDTVVKADVRIDVLNANLATNENLVSAGLDEATLNLILDNRPFLNMAKLDSLLGTETDKANIYNKIFVPFNLNSTPEEDFKMIPGVGERMAHEFEEYRPYTSIKQFRIEIGKYVDQSEIDRYEKYVFVPIELNTAKEEDIKALPGVGDRMAHEFEEYRPYTSIQQFRKQIGKYVDDKELERLVRLVYLKE